MVGDSRVGRAGILGALILPQFGKFDHNAHNMLECQSNVSLCTLKSDSIKQTAL